MGNSDFGPLTLEAWVNATALDREAQPIVALFGPYRSQMNWYIDHWYVLDRENGMHDVQPTSTNRWIHLAMVLDEKTKKFFVDGKEVAHGVRTDVSIKDAAAPSAWIGGHKPQAGDSASHVFHGLIDEVRVSKTARYTNDFVPKKRFEPDSDTIALYHFDEGLGDVLKDSSVNNHHGKIVGAKWVTVESPSKLLNNAIAFDGTSSYVDIPTLERNRVGPTTLETWVRNHGQRTSNLFPC